MIDWLNDEAIFSFGRQRFVDHPILQQFGGLNINIENCSLVQSLNKADNVIGCPSYTLYLAHHCGKKVFSANFLKNANFSFKWVRLFGLRSMIYCEKGVQSDNRLDGTPQKQKQKQKHVGLLSKLSWIATTWLVDGLEDTYHDFLST